MRLHRLPLILVSTASLSAQTAPQWRHTAPAEVSSFLVTPIGNVVVLSPGRAAALDPVSGVVTWARDSLRGSGDHWWFSTAPGTPFGLLDLGDRVEVVDLATGAKRWDTSALGPGGLKGYLPVPERKLLLVYLAWGKDSSALVAADMATGDVRWRHANPFTVAPKRYRALTSGQDATGSSLADEQPAQWVSDTTFLLYVSEDGPVLVHANTGAFLWRAEGPKGKRPPALRDLYPPALIAEGVAYVPCDKDLHAIRLTDGTPLWPKPVELPSRILQLELTARGLLVRGVRRENDARKDGSFVDLLDPATGASRWPKPFKRGWSVLHSEDAPATISPFTVRGDRVYFASDGKLYAMGLGDGSAKELGKVKFKGDEEPTLVESRSDGILLQSPQNVLLVDTAGAVRYQSYYPAPPMGLLGHIGSVLLRVALDVASYSFAQAEANRTGVPQTYTQYENPFLRIRYAAAEAARDYVYILTSEKDSAGQARSSIVKVSKDRNRVEGRVWLSDKSPAFALDPVTATVYVKTGPQEVAAFKL